MYKIICLMGVLHSEMTALKMLGKWCSCSSSAKALCHVGVATQGMADSFFAASRLTWILECIRWPQPVFNILISKGSRILTTVDSSGQVKSFQEQNLGRNARKVPHFVYMACVLDLQLCYLAYQLFHVCQSHKVDVTMVFGNYPHWFSVHHRDMWASR